ncbi:MAG: glutamine--tRNA ligase/YqeY domain fusion protein [Christensenellaceae bacterium]|jgi:glutaminyl-tRNA synthetase|nr:glutamine--tRNA ligase/YqeY domain fusion protein [Christensenellaceae bacterium]
MESDNFIEDIIVKDLQTKKITIVNTRFPPEPNGYLHIGHAKSISINFGIKEKFLGKCNLRFDDTNPTKEDLEYVNSIKKDIQWLGYKWDHELYASDYFQKTYEAAIILIKKGLAYVCDLSAEEIRKTRGTLNEPGIESPYRTRTIETNLELFTKMKNGEFPDGSRVLRAKIDMASPNINMRDPVIYRILRATHHRTGDDWLIYPMYDFAHPIGDAIENITHSICTLEFENHRPLYDWVTANCDFKKPYPQQIEFARLNMKNTVMSKRYLKKLVDDGFVKGWDDPRMPTLSGLRERGYPPEAIREFCARIGVGKANSEVDPELLDFCVREHLNKYADRAMAIENPLKVVIENIDNNQTFECIIDNNPNDPKAGKHNIVLRREIYIDNSDFSLSPPPKYHRLFEGSTVRLKGSFVLQHVKTCMTPDSTKIDHIVCRYLPDTQPGGINSGMKVKGVIQWVSIKDAIDTTLHKYEALLNDPKDGVLDFNERLNYNSIEIIDHAKVEPFALEGDTAKSFQFMRMAYYKRVKTNDGVCVFRRIVSLKDKFNAKN